MVGQLRNPRNVLVRISNKEDFITVMARGNAKLAGIPYKISHWMPNFIEEEDLPWPGLPPNFFHELSLRSIGGGFG